MDLETYVGHLGREGRHLAAAAERGDGSESVPACPGWSLHDLVAHVGVVHQWALEALGGRGRPPSTSKDELLGRVPRSSPTLSSWYLEQNEALVQALRRVDPEAEIWTLWPDTTVGATVGARRQAHETAVHRCDAQQATGTATAFDATLASDGIDELLTMAALSHRPWRDRDHVRMGVHASDTGAAWVLDVRGRGRSLERAEGPADTRLEGGAGEVFTFLWNRPVQPPPRRSGDTGLWDTWADLVQIH